MRRSGLFSLQVIHVIRGHSEDADTNKFSDLKYYVGEMLIQYALKDVPDHKILSPLGCPQYGSSL